VWDVLVPFAGYAFNKAHSAAYGLVSYWTAYLKANYPAEYMAAVLTSVGDDKDKSALYLSESRRMGVKVLPPDVNASVATFTAVGADVRFGLAAIRNVGANVVEAIIAARRSKGDFTSFADFLRKVPAVVCNKRVIESLVKAGAFDSFGHPRKGLALIHEQAVDSVIDIKRNEAIGQDSLFGGDEQAEAAFEVAIPDTEWDKKTRLNFEREMLGLYVSDHPLLGVEHIIARDADVSVAELMATGEEGDEGDEGDRPAVFQGGRNDGQIVKIGGILSGVTRKVTKKGDAWAAATLEDLGGAIEVLFFPNSYQLYATAIADDAIVIVKGKVDKRDDVPKLIAMDMTIPDLTTGADGSAPIVLQLPVTKCVPPVVEQLRDVLRTHPGTTEVHLRLRGNQKTTVVRLDDKLRVTPGPALHADLKQLLGPSCIAS
jgi:DNA polymerase III subunit alpha